MVRELRSAAGQAGRTGVGFEEDEATSVRGEGPDPGLADGETVGDRARVEGEVTTASGGAQHADPVKDGGGDGEPVLKEGGSGPGDTGAQCGQGPAGVARRHQSGQVCGFDELNGLDLARRGSDRRDLVLVPDAAIEDVQDLAGEPQGGSGCGAGGGDPVDSQPAGDVRRDAELLLQLASSALGGGLALVDCAAGRSGRVR